MTHTGAPLLFQSLSLTTVNKPGVALTVAEARYCGCVRRGRSPTHMIFEAPGASERPLLNRSGHGICHVPRLVALVPGPCIALK